MKGKGFTLIELLIVIAIISIISAIFIPMFTKYRIIAKLEKGEVLSDEELKRYNDNKEEWDKRLSKRRGGATAEKDNAVEKKVEVEKEEEKQAVEKDVVVEASQSDLRLFEKPVVKKDAVVEAPTTQAIGSIPPIPPIN